MEERASGIILRTRPLTETSLIVQWLAAGPGRIATVAKGARRPKSSFAGKLDLFYEADFSFVRSRKSELHMLREVSVRQVHASLREDLARLNAAAYCAVLFEQGIERETPVPEYLALLQDLLAVLDRHSPGAALIFAVEIKFLELAGAAPNRESLSTTSAKVVQTLADFPVEASVRLALPPSVAREISSFLRRAIGMTLERLPPQRERLFQSLTPPAGN